MVICFRDSFLSWIFVSGIVQCHSICTLCYLYDVIVCCGVCKVSRAADSRRLRRKMFMHWTVMAINRVKVLSFILSIRNRDSFSIAQVKTNSLCFVPISSDSDKADVLL